MSGANNLTREAEELLRQRYGTNVFATTIRRRVRVSEDALYQSSVLSYAPKSPSADEYRALAAEVLARVEHSGIGGMDKEPVYAK